MDKYKRKILFWLANLFGNTKFEGIFIMLLSILGIIFPLLNGNSIERFFDFKTARDIVIYVLVVIIILIAVFVLLQLLSYLLAEWGKTFPPNIQVIPVDYPNAEHDFENSKFVFFNSLKIVNNEDAKLTNCYAILKNGNPITKFIGVFELSWLEDKSREMKWKNNNNCKIEIGAWNGEATLLLYQLKVNEGKVFSSGFRLCDSDPIRKFPNGSYEFEFELHGELNGVEFKPISYYGLFDIITTNNIDGEGNPSIKIKPMRIRDLRRNLSDRKKQSLKTEYLKDREKNRI